MELVYYFENELKGMNPDALYLNGTTDKSRDGRTIVKLAREVNGCEVLFKIKADTRIKAVKYFLNLRKERGVDILMLNETPQGNKKLTISGTDKSIGFFCYEK